MKKYQMSATQNINDSKLSFLKISLPWKIFLHIENKTNKQSWLHIASVKHQCVQCYSLKFVFSGARIHQQVNLIVMFITLFLSATACIPGSLYNENYTMLQNFLYSHHAHWIPLLQRRPFLSFNQFSWEKITISNAVFDIIWDLRHCMVRYMYQYIFV